MTNEEIQAALTWQRFDIEEFKEETVKVYKEDLEDLITAIKKLETRIQVLEHTVFLFVEYRDNNPKRKIERINYPKLNI